MKTKLLKKLRAESRKVIILKDIVFSHNTIKFYISRITKIGFVSRVYEISGDPTVIADFDYIKINYIDFFLEAERKRYILERVYELRCNKAKKVIIKF